VNRKVGCFFQLKYKKITEINQPHTTKSRVIKAFVQTTDNVPAMSLDRNFCAFSQLFFCVVVAAALHIHRYVKPGSVEHQDNKRSGEILIF
jgi:hypothetical protein